MKKLKFSLLAMLLVSSVFYLSGCCKDIPFRHIRVSVTFDESTEVVTFTGKQGQGTFTFNDGQPSHVLPNRGTWTISLSYGGGCGCRVSDNTTNLLFVGPAGGTDSLVGTTLKANYSTWQSCE